jgi:Lon protease-like protein
MIPPPRQPVPVFPLPDIVLFPDVELALHVFELRYRTMVRDALSGERWLAIATLKPGYELDYHGSPEFHELGCLGRFEDVEWLPNDCYNLKLRGAQRVRFGKPAREFPYRACPVEVLEEAPFDPEGPLAALERAALVDEAHKLLPLGAEAWTSPPLRDEAAPFPAVVNAIAQTLRIGTAARLELLAMDSVLDRARRLHDHLKGFGASSPPQAPPGTGRN